VNPVAREACSSADTIEGFRAALKSSTGRKWTTYFNKNELLGLYGIWPVMCVIMGNYIKSIAMYLCDSVNAFTFDIAEILLKVALNTKIQIHSNVYIYIYIYIYILTIGEDRRNYISTKVRFSMKPR
jgi:hypothetical protein